MGMGSVKLRLQDQAARDALPSVDSDKVVLLRDLPNGKVQPFAELKSDFLANTAHAAAQTGGTGLTDAEVDALITARGYQTVAQINTLIANMISTGDFRSAQQVMQAISDTVADWAKAANDSEMPFGKLPQMSIIDWLDGLGIAYEDQLNSIYSDRVLTAPTPHIFTDGQAFPVSFTGGETLPRARNRRLKITISGGSEGTQFQHIRWGDLADLTTGTASQTLGAGEFIILDFTLNPLDDADANKHVQIKVGRSSRNDQLLYEPLWPSSVGGSSRGRFTRSVGMSVSDPGFVVTGGAIDAHHLTLYRRQDETNSSQVLTLPTTTHADPPTELFDQMFTVTAQNRGVYVADSGANEWTTTLAALADVFLDGTDIGDLERSAWVRNIGPVAAGDAASSSNGIETVGDHTFFISRTTDNKVIVGISPTETTGDKFRIQITTQPVAAVRPPTVYPLVRGYLTLLFNKIPPITYDSSNDTMSFAWRLEDLDTALQAAINKTSTLKRPAYEAAEKWQSTDIGELQNQNYGTGSIDRPKLDATLQTDFGKVDDLQQFAYDETAQVPPSQLPPVPSRLITVKLPAGLPFDILTQYYTPRIDATFNTVQVGTKFRWGKGLGSVDTHGGATDTQIAARLPAFEIDTTNRRTTWYLPDPSRGGQDWRQVFQEETPNPLPLDPGEGGVTGLGLQAVPWDGATNPPRYLTVRTPAVTTLPVGVGDNALDINLRNYSDGDEANFEGASNIYMTGAPILTEAVYDGETFIASLHPAIRRVVAAFPANPTNGLSIILAADGALPEFTDVGGAAATQGLAGDFFHYDTATSKWVRDLSIAAHRPFDWATHGSTLPVDPSKITLPYVQGLRPDPTSRRPWSLLVNQDEVLLNNAKDSHNIFWDPLLKESELPDDDFPNWLAATPASGYFFPGRQHNTAVRDDRLISWGTYQPVTQLSGSPQTPRTVDVSIGLVQGGKSLSPAKRPLFYGPQHHDATLRNRIRISSVGGRLDLYGALTLKAKLRSRTTGNEGSYVFTRDVHGRYVTAPLAAQDRPPRTGGLMDVNIETGTLAIPFLYLTPASDVNRAIHSGAWAPQELFAMIDTQWTEIRRDGDNVWFDTGWNINNTLKGGAQMYGFMFFEFHIPNRVPYCATRPVWIRDILRLTRLSHPGGGTSRAANAHANLNRKRLREIMSATAVDFQADGVANCLMCELQGKDIVDVGLWEDGNLQFMTDHAGSFIAGSKFNVHFGMGPPWV